MYTRFRPIKVYTLVWTAGMAVFLRFRGNDNDGGLSGEFCGEISEPEPSVPVSLGHSGDEDDMA